MSVIIPTQEFASWSQTTRLDDVDYLLTFSWNGREETWQLTFAKPDGTILLAGLKLVPDFELISRFALEDFPVGYLILSDTTGKSEYPTRENLSTRYALIYYSEDDLIAPLI